MCEMEYKVTKWQKRKINYDFPEFTEAEFPTAKNTEPQYQLFSWHQSMINHQQQLVYERKFILECSSLSKLANSHISRLHKGGGLLFGLVVSQESKTFERISSLCAVVKAANPKNFTFH